MASHPSKSVGEILEENNEHKLLSRLNVDDREEFELLSVEFLEF
jgi:hypothetical protein